MNDYDCMIDKNENIIKMDTNDEETISIDDTLTVINTINDTVLCHNHFSKPDISFNLR